MACPDFVVGVDVYFAGELAKMLAESLLRPMRLTIRLFRSPARTQAQIARIRRSSYCGLKTAAIYR